MCYKSCCFPPQEYRYLEVKTPLFLVHRRNQSMSMSQLLNNYLKPIVALSFHIYQIMHYKKTNYYFYISLIKIFNFNIRLTPTSSWNICFKKYIQLHWMSMLCELRKLNAQKMWYSYWPQIDDTFTFWSIFKELAAIIMIAHMRYSIILLKYETGWLRCQTENELRYLS